MSAIFVYGIATTVCSNDPAAIIGKAMAPMKVAERRPALTALDAAREVMAACDASNGLPATKLAMRLLAPTATRPCQVVAQWRGRVTTRREENPATGRKIPSRADDCLRQWFQIHPTPSKGGCPQATGAHCCRTRPGSRRSVFPWCFRTARHGHRYRRRCATGRAR